MQVIPPVETLEDVRALIEATGPVFHPDTPGAEYRHPDGSPVFEGHEADQYDAALSQAAVIAAAEGTDLYALAAEVNQAWLDGERFEILAQEVVRTDHGNVHQGWFVSASGLTRLQVLAKRSRPFGGIQLERVRPIAVPEIPADAGPTCAMGHPVIVITKATFWLTVQGEQVARAVVAADAGDAGNFNPHPFGVWSCAGDRCEAEISDEAGKEAIRIASETDWPQPQLEG
jgi:hypothetical protein